MEQIQIIEKLFYYIVTFSYLLIPISFFVSGSRKKGIIPLSLALYAIICCCFLFLYDFFKDDIRKDLRPYFQTSYTFFEYAIFTLIFWVNIKHKRIRRMIVVASVLFFAFQLFYLLSGQVHRLDTVPIGIETILILTYILYFFYEFSKKLDNFYIYNHYGFWIAVGVLIYLGGSFFFFIEFNLLTKDQRLAFGNMTYLAEIIKNILFSLAIFIYARYSFKNSDRKKPSMPYLDMI